MVIALGGGVIGDLVGFAASCYQRGIDFIQIPTTHFFLQVDSSVGGKTAVNHPLARIWSALSINQNLSLSIQTAYQLPEREFAAGIAEVIKYGIIYDETFFDWLELNLEKLYQLDEQALITAIARCCAIKAEVVAIDEKESRNQSVIEPRSHTFGLRLKQN